MSKTELDKKMFGYNKEQVRQHLEHLDKSHQEELEKLQKSLEEARLARKLSSEKLEELQAAKEERLKPAGFMELALIRAKESTVLLKDKSLKESEEILQGGQEKNNYYEKKAINIKNEMRRTKAYFETVLKHMQQLLEEKGPDSNELPNNNLRKLVSFNNNPQADKSGSKTGEDKENLNVAEEQKLTADGMPNPDIDPKKKEGQQDQFKRVFEKVSRILVKQSLPVTEDEQAAGAEKAEQDSAENNSAAIGTGGFWEEDLTEINPETGEKESDLPDLVLGSASNEAVLNEAAPNPEQIESGVAPNSELHSPAVSAQIMDIRQKYIVGKIAGEDIIDSSGRKIIGKKELITAEVVTAVEKEGKLPELIVNMILPGMEV